MIGSRLGPYEITAKLGEGGMGEVYRARDTKLERDVAIKVLPALFVEDPERLQRLEREAKLLAQLHHPNIASIFGMEESEGRKALVMELVEGPTLAERLEHGALPLEESLSVALQIAQALEEAHEKGIIHRDLKPQNIKASIEGKVKVLDFGLAKAMDPAGGAPGSVASASQLAQSPTLTLGPTLMGVILGTAGYMAPEQAAGSAVDRRADVWSFGVVLYELLTGRRLFQGDSVSHVLAAVLKDEPDFSLLPAETPPSIRRLLRRCLRKKPRERLQAIGDARIVLEEMLAGTADEPPASALGSSQAPPRSVWPTRVALGLLTVATVALGLRVALDRAPRAGVVRSALLPPAGVSFHLDGIRPGPLALSPDGRHVVFTGAAEDGRRTLWVRSVDSFEPREMASTDGAQFPFWSPDSRQIGFFTDDKLKKIPLAGGPPVPLADVVVGKGGAWSPHGVIVFAARFNVPLMKVSEEGGAVAPVTAFSANGEETSHRHPRFLPDGRRFLFVAQRGSQPGELRVGSIDGSPTAPLFASDYAAEFAKGRLLFVRESTLLAQPFDPGSLKLSGAATPLVESVFRIVGSSAAVFSASREGTLAFLTGGAEERSRLVWRDRKGTEVGTLGEPDRFGFPRLSPDGRSLAIEALETAKNRRQIWIYDLERGLRSRFATGDGDVNWPVWSPDGESIAFSAATGGPSRELRAAAVTGTEPPRTLSEGEPMWLMTCDWSPDKRFLVAENVASGARNDLLLLPAEGGEPRPLVASQEAWEHSGAVSPDGRWLAFHSNESGGYEVYVTSFPVPSRKWQVSQRGGQGPRWRGDGREIFYDDGTALFVAEVDGSGQAFQVGAVRRLFESPFKSSEGLRYDVTRDGQRFLMAEPLADDELASISLVQNWDADLPP